MSRPSRTQQLENPEVLYRLKLAEKPGSGAGTADKILEAREKERALNQKDEETKKRRRLSARFINCEIVQILIFILRSSSASSDSHSESESGSSDDDSESDGTESDSSSGSDSDARSRSSSVSSGSRRAKRTKRTRGRSRSSSR